MNIWQVFLYQPIFNLLIFFYKILFFNLGLAIIALTLFIRSLLIPLTLPSLKAAKKQKELAPLLKKIQEKYKNDKKKQAEEQMKLFQKHGINPALGCLPQIVQILILIALYQVFIGILGDQEAVLNINKILYLSFLHLKNPIQTSFLYLNLGKPDPYFILPILAGVSQFLTSKLLMSKTKKGKELAEKTPDKRDDLMYTMSEQMLYLMPVMTVLIGAKVPSGLALYWLVTTVFSLAQQWLIIKRK